MFKLKILILYLFFYNTASYGYLDPVTTGIIYQILFFLIAGFITFFTKVNKLLKFLNKDYKYSQNIIIFVGIFPFWILLSDFDLKESLIAFAIFLIIPLIIINLIKRTFHNKKILLSIITSFVAVYGLDHAFGLSSIINLLRIIDEVIRYASFFLLFVILTIIIFYIFYTSKKTINFFIIVIILSNVFNFISGKKNINNFKKHELKDGHTETFHPRLLNIHTKLHFHAQL